MNIHLTKEEFEQLPFRDDWQGEYLANQYYRAKAHSSTVFKWKGTNQAPEWWAFSVSFRE